MIFLLLVSMVIIATHAAPASVLGVGNSMMPEVHATGLIPMIEGTNVPESEEEIDAPIYDDKEVEKILGLAKNMTENARNPEKAMGGFIESHPGFMSTVETLRVNGFGETTPVTAQEVSTSPGPIFTLATGVPTVSAEKVTTTTVKSV